MGNYFVAFLKVEIQNQGSHKEAVPAESLEESFLFACAALVFQALLCHSYRIPNSAWPPVRLLWCLRLLFCLLLKTVVIDFRIISC